jgi:TonB family protein
MNQGSVGYLSLIGSVVLHAFAVVQNAGEMPKRRHPPSPAFVELTTPEPLPEPPAVRPPPPDPEPPKPAPERRRPAPPHEEPTPEPASAPPDAEAPDLAGVTLTGGEGASFSALEGNGAARDAIAVRETRRTGVAGAVRPAVPLAPPPALPLSRLSQKPVPPALEAALERNYPREARQLGKSGDAKVRARVEASGEIRVASIVSATSPDFGEACRRTLIGSRWSAPLDGNGRRAATSIYYRCKFRID